MTVAPAVGTNVGTGNDAGVNVTGATVVGAGVGANTGAAVGNVMVGSTRTRLGYVLTSCACTALVARDSLVAIMLGLALLIVSLYETVTPKVRSVRRLKDNTV